jgi:hypothetical protein
MTKNIIKSSKFLVDQAMKKICTISVSDALSLCNN